MCNLSLFLVPLTDQDQNQYLRKASETWERESKVVGLTCLWTTNVQNTWNRLRCRNCLIGFAELFSRCVLKLSKPAITNPMIIDFNTTFLNHTWEKLLKCLKQTTDQQPFIQTSSSWKIQSCFKIDRANDRVSTFWCFGSNQHQVISAASSLLFFNKHLWINLKLQHQIKGKWKC